MEWYRDINTGTRAVYLQKLPFTATKPEEGEEAPATSQTAPASDPALHNPYGTTTKFSVLSGPPNPPKVEIYLRKAIRRHLG